MAVPLFDSHNHLQDDSLLPHLPAVLRELTAAGVTRVVVNGTKEGDWDAVAALAQEHPWVIPSFGLHPWHLPFRTAGWRDSLRSFLEKFRGGIGEIGLDRGANGSNIEDQEEVFTWQLALAAEQNLPATIHCTKAWGILWEILSKQAVPACGFLLHGYGGPVEMVKGFVDRGAYFSFSGSFLNPTRMAGHDVFRQIPSNRLLVETDAPFMPLPAEQTRWQLPDGPDGKRINHPANIVATYEGLAELRGWTMESLTGQVAENFARLFGEET